MHGVRTELLKQQAENIGIELKEIPLPEITPLNLYDEIMKENFEKLKAEGIEYSIFGDIFLEDLRAYREAKLKLVNMEGVFPLWKRPTSELMNEFIELGFKTIVVCVNAKYLDKSFTGRVIDKDFLNDLPENVDPCGENGEFHTFVFDGPLFKNAISFKKGEVVYKEYGPEADDKSEDKKTSTVHDSRFWYIDLLEKD